MLAGQLAATDVSTSKHRKRAGPPACARPTRSATASATPISTQPPYCHSTEAASALAPYCTP